MQSSTTEQNVPWNPLLGLDFFFLKALKKESKGSHGETDKYKQHTCSSTHTKTKACRLIRPFAL